MDGTEKAVCGTPGDVVDPRPVHRLATELKVLADPTRLHLLAILASSPEGEACVCDLTGPLGLSQPTVSHHMKVLSKAGLVGRERRGAWVYYSIVDDAVGELTGRVADLLRSATRQPSAV